MENFNIFTDSENKMFNRLLSVILVNEGITDFKLVTKHFKTYQPTIIFVSESNVELFSNYPNDIKIGLYERVEQLVAFHDIDIFTSLSYNLKFDKLKKFLLDRYNKFLFTESLKLDKLKQAKSDKKKLSSSNNFFFDILLKTTKNGIAYLNEELIIKVQNKKFSEMFDNIFDVKPAIGKKVTHRLDSGDFIFWNELNSQRKKDEEIVKAYSTNDKNNHKKYYIFYINTVYQENKYLGLAINIHDISTFRTANNDLKKYYKFVLRQMDELEKANIEIGKKNKFLNDAYEKVNSLSRIDFLTQLSNRRSFIEKITYEQLRFKRHNTPFILAYGDIDDFKKLNDTYGHDAGDYVLVCLSKIILETIRDVDFASRWGGEEFLIFIEEQNEDRGKLAINRLLKNIENYNFNFKNKSLHVTMTFGMSIYKKDEDINVCIAKADKRLYIGKHNGKNRVVYKEEERLS